jgi:DNA gyrase/topoisomerase IV subunit A
MLFSSEGKAMRFKRATCAHGARQPRRARDQSRRRHRMISLLVPDERGAVLTVSENGYGKRTAVGDFPTKGRAGKGVIAMASSERNGRLVGAVQVFSGDELMLISNQGTAVRTPPTRCPSSVATRRVCGSFAPRPVSAGAGGAHRGQRRRAAALPAKRSTGSATATASAADSGSDE